MRAFGLRLVLGVALAVLLIAPGAQGASEIGRPIVVPVAPAPPAAAACLAQQLRATYSFVPGSNATGHVEYTLTVTNRSTTSPCRLGAPLKLTLLGKRGQALPTHARSTPAGSYATVLAPGQWAQATSQLSPDLFGPGEPARGNCEPVAHALRIAIGPANLRAPMDPTPVCEHGTIEFNRLAVIAPTPVCSASLLRASFKRDSPPSLGIATYSLTLRNQLADSCHTNSIVGLRLLGSGGHKLATRIRAGISSPYVFPAHAVESAFAMLSTRPSHGCDLTASRLAITPSPGHGTVTTAIAPALRVCSGGLIELSGLFVNG